MDQLDSERLERLTKIVARSGGITEGEAERIGASPFLLTRLRAGIESERRSRAEQGSGWLGTLLVASRAIAVMAIVTIAAVLMLWFSRTNASDAVSDLHSSADDPISRVVTGGTCALSTTEECAISTGEVLATLFAENGGKEQK